MSKRAKLCCEISLLSPVNARLELNQTCVVRRKERNQNPVPDYPKVPSVGGEIKHITQEFEKQKQGGRMQREAGLLRWSIGSLADTTRTHNHSIVRRCHRPDLAPVAVQH